MCCFVKADDMSYCIAAGLEFASGCVRELRVQLQNAKTYLLVMHIALQASCFKGCRLYA